MLIKILSVSAAMVPGKKYKKIEVAFKNDKGEVKGKNVMDFSINSGLDILLSAQPGDALDILTVKEGEYWNWKEVRKADGSSMASAPAPATASTGASRPSTGYSAPARDFESKDERAARQVMIVRQSSISSAIALLKTEKLQPDTDAVLKVAKQFEEFVMGTGKAPDTGIPELVDMEDDLPLQLLTERKLQYV